MKIIIWGALLVFFSINGGASATQNGAIEVETEGSYRVEKSTSIGIARKMALFIAKQEAVGLAGKYLSRKSLIEVYELNRDEIYNLAAREIEAEILEEKYQKFEKPPTYCIRIRARVHAADFIKAEMEDTKLNKKEAQESFREEMEQPVSAEIDPGRDISKVYRLLREKKWRIAMIYMDHLEKKYPDWAEIHMAKALVYFIYHEPVFMKDALTKACQLGNNMACSDLKNIKKIHDYDFGLSIFDKTARPRN